MYNSITVAAQIMNVHRNTMIYRLNKFSELSGLDLNKQKVREILLFSYRIIDLFPDLTAPV